MIIYNEEKKELIIPTGIGNIDNTIYYDEGFTDGYSSGRTDGYHEGYGNGYNNGRQDVLDSLTSPAIYYGADWEGLGTINPEPPSLGMRSVKVHAQEYGNAKYNEGYNQGFNGGFTEGYANGFTDGYANGWNDGHESGYTDGYASGFTDGYASGFTDGYASGLTFIPQTTYEFVFPIESIVAHTHDGNEVIINGVESDVCQIEVSWMPNAIIVSASTSDSALTTMELTILFQDGVPDEDIPVSLSNPTIDGLYTATIISQSRERLEGEPPFTKPYKYTLNFDSAPLYNKASFEAGLAACQNNENQ